MILNFINKLTTVILVFIYLIAIVMQFPIWILIKKYPFTNMMKIIMDKVDKLYKNKKSG